MNSSRDILGHLIAYSPVILWAVGMAIVGVMEIQPATARETARV